MLATWIKKTKRLPKKKDRGFDPSSEVVKKATDQYIRKGGKITVISELGDIENFDNEAADEYLSNPGQIVPENYLEGCFF